MKNSSDSATIFYTLFIILWVIVYIVNFVQLLHAISQEQIGLVIIKLLGVFTALGSFITVWI